MQIYCPSDTQDLVNRNEIEISNFALQYRHFLEWRLDENKVKFGLQAQTPNNAPSLGHSQQALKHLRNRQTDQSRYLASNGHFYCAISQIDWRMVVGLGGDHVQETNMTLNHVYGIPYLPGSAFKGIVRSWVIQKDFGNDENLAMRDIEDGDSDDLKQKKKDFFAVFGSPKSSGKVQFFDALPASGVHFDIDIMNPHFSTYYTGATFPTDDQRLIQIYFLTLKDTHFRFLILAKAAAPLQLAKDWFTEAVANRGFGAKSAVGYGYFRELDDKTEELKEEFAEKLSLNQAYDIYQNHPSQWESVRINVEPLVNYAPKFAVIVTEEICEIEKIGGVNEIPESLVEAEVGMVVPSEFGRWAWEKTKDKLFDEVLPTFPNLVYRSAFQRTLGNLQPDQRKLLQEKLLEIAIDARRALNSNLSPADRDLFEEKLLQIAEDLANDAVFVNLSPTDRDSLEEKLFEIAEDLANDEEIPDSIAVEGGRTIVCGGIENGNLVLRRYINQ
jgi:CRISPR-associated protein Cmr6